MDLRDSFLLRALTKPKTRTLLDHMPRERDIHITRLADNCRVERTHISSLARELIELGILEKPSRGRYKYTKKGLDLVADIDSAFLRFRTRDEYMKY